MGDRRGHAGGPYPVESISRRYVEVSLATGIPFSTLLLEDDQTIATYLELLDERTADQ